MFGLYNIPTFDFQVQVHRMIVKAFASFDGLQQGNEDQSPAKGQLVDNIITDAIDIDLSIHP
jgi:hypothetical protein